MKNITRLALAIAAAAISVFAISCTRFEYKEDLSVGGKVFHASFETAGIPDTKTYLDSDHKMHWTEGDRISVFEGDRYNRQYRYTGQTGNTSADFEKVSSDSYSENTLSSNYAVYPYLQDNHISKNGKLTVILPTVQQYAEGSFGLGANTMVAVTNGTSDTFLAFKNLCGYLVIKLYGEGTVKSISFKGNNREKIAGSATVTASYGSKPELSMALFAKEEITLDCGSGVELGSTSSTATEFWFCIPPVEFSKGFSITVTDTAGGVMEKSLSSSRTISRNTINSMSAIKAEFSELATPVPEMVDLGLSVKWASFNVGASKPEEYGGEYQWAGKKDVTNIEIETFDFDNCPYHTKGAGFSSGWTKYIRTEDSLCWAGAGRPDNKIILDPQDDIANGMLGGKWRMPTKTEFDELINNCIVDLTEINGVKGLKVISNKPGYAGNYIFLPATNTGTTCYWSSSLALRFPWEAFGFYFWATTGSCGTDDFYRNSGLLVRPVYDSNDSVTGVSLNLTNLRLYIGETFNLIATASPSTATDQSVSWSSSAPDVVSVDQNGKVSAVNEGSAIVTVRTTDGGHTATCSVTVEHPGTIEEIDIPNIVDLGLSVKWASFNIGASKPEEYGGYYQWAGTQDVTSTSIDLGGEKCPYCIFTGLHYYHTKYVPSDKSSYWYGPGSPDDKTVLDPEDDIACMTLGGKWRMPTYEEWEELVETCTWTWTDNYIGTGVAGMIVSSTLPGYLDRSIFLPAAGHRGIDVLFDSGYYCDYWSSSLDADSPYGARNLHVSVSVKEFRDDDRSFGCSVRPIYDDCDYGEKISVTGVSLDPTSLSLYIGETYDLCATVTPSNASEQDVRWTSSDSGVATVNKHGTVTGMKEGNATITVSTTDGSYTATCVVTVKSPDHGVPGTVDLGLSVKWATFNIGATKPEEYGDYYQWGSVQNVTSTNIYLDWNNCPYHTGSDKKTGWNKYIPSDESSYWSGIGDPDNKAILDQSDDVAHETFGKKWRMPASEEWEELMKECVWNWTQLNGVNGYKVTGKKFGYTDKWIFLPAAGCRIIGDLRTVGSQCCYWSSSLNIYLPENANGTLFSSNDVKVTRTYRYYGLSVRPVYDEELRVTGVSLDPTSLNLNVGETSTLCATVTPSNAADKSVSWTSSDTGIATVDQSGKVTAVGAGNATITVKTTDGGYTATCSVTVKNSDNPPTTENPLVGTSWTCSFSDEAKYNTIYVDITLTFDSQSTFVMTEDETNVVKEHYIDLDGDGIYDEYVEGGTDHNSYTENGTYKVDGSTLELFSSGWYEPISGTISGNIITLYGDEDIIFQKL